MSLDPELAQILERYAANGHPVDGADGAVDDADGDALGVTEDALALAFSRRHAETLRYIHEWGKWLRWDGARWASERTLAVYDLARRLTREIGQTIGTERQAARLASAATVNAVVMLARADRRHARVTEDFDTDPWLLNSPDGTIDLRTGTMRPHCRADGITKVTPIAPIETEAPLWRACLETWTEGDPELAAFLQRFAGYVCTGSTKEEVLPIVYGSGGNGKTKFVETLRACLGSDYVTGVAMETLIVTAGEQHPTDVADLRGKRLAIATETEEGRRLAEAKVKALTGGDRLRARFMRRDFFEFNPSHKLLIVGNHRPALRNVDEAMRRRLLLIPFAAVIPPEARDPDLAEKLSVEWPAILRWMIDGCREWQAQGLRPPDRVRAATLDYFETANALGRWLEECCVLGPNESATKAAVFACWKSWAEAAGEFVGSARRLNEQLCRHPGVDEARLGHSGAKAWIGLGLRADRPC